MRVIIIFSLFVLISCSSYKELKKPLRHAPKYIEWYFLNRTKVIRDDIKTKNPTYSDSKLDSLAFIEIGKIMCSITPQQYEMIERAYHEQCYNIFDQ